MKDLDSSLVHSSWEPIFEPIEGLIIEILSRMDDEPITPPRELIFKAFSMDFDHCLCVEHDACDGSSPERHGRGVGATPQPTHWLWLGSGLRWYG